MDIQPTPSQQLDRSPDLSQIRAQINGDRPPVSVDNNRSLRLENNKSDDERMQENAKYTKVLETLSSITLVKGLFESAMDIFNDPEIPDKTKDKFLRVLEKQDATISRDVASLVAVMETAKIFRSDTIS